mmetsp:Transcript_33028/g.94687  ORF Transcript_33028/g.94687 Transcript_33028/m.94687 type:complete len:401 (+) Transcript_33028:868-2070(+)
MEGGGVDPGLVQVVADGEAQRVRLQPHLGCPCSHGYCPVMHLPDKCAVQVLFVANLNNERAVGFRVSSFVDAPLAPGCLWATEGILNEVGKVPRCLKVVEGHHTLHPESLAQLQEFEDTPALARIRMPEALVRLPVLPGAQHALPAVAGDVAHAAPEAQHVDPRGLQLARDVAPHRQAREPPPGARLQKHKVDRQRPAPSRQQQPAAAAQALALGRPPAASHAPHCRAARSLRRLQREVQARPAAAPDAEGGAGQDEDALGLRPHRCAHLKLPLLQASAYGARVEVALVLAAGLEVHALLVQAAVEYACRCRGTRGKELRLFAIEHLRSDRLICRRVRTGWRANCGPGRREASVWRRRRVTADPCRACRLFKVFSIHHLRIKATIQLMVHILDAKTKQCR